MNKHLWAKRLRGCMPDHLTPTEYVVLTMLATYTNTAGTSASPAATTLADDCGKSVNTIRRALAALVDKGYVIVTRSGGGHRRPTVYALVEDVPNAARNLPTQMGTNIDDEPTNKPTHPDGYEESELPTHPDEYPSEKLPTHPERLTYPNGSTYLPTQMGKDQREDQERDQELPTPLPPAVPSPAGEFSDGVPLPPEPHHDDTPPNLTRGSLALVPDRFSSMPKRTRQQALAALNATARSQTADRIATAFADSLDGTLDRQTLVEIGQVCDQLIRDHVPIEQIAAGIRAWHDSDSWSPTQIRRFVAKAARNRNQQTTVTARIADAHNLADDLIREMNL